MKYNILFIYILFVSYSISSAQQPHDSISHIGPFSISIDGSADDPVWATVEAIGIDQDFQTEVPTLNSATWKAVWDEEGIYLLVEASDDVWMPSWESGLADWQSDKVEVYIDVTTPQKDGGGAKAENGNHSVGPNFNQNNPGVTYEFGTQGTLYSCSFDGFGNYKMEYFIAFDALPDENGERPNPFVLSTIGFDVTVIDLDDVNEGRNRAVWANTGAIDESWNNMDDVGLITFSRSEDYLIAVFTCSDKLKGPDETIQFNDFSGGTPTEWLWDFGDGNTSTEQHPSHSYSAIGTYTVSLTVHDANDSVSTSVKNDLIIITDAALKPRVEFSANTTSAKTNQPISFTDDTKYNPTSWTWYFGDGGVSIEQNPTHYYKSAGTYAVTLVASNINGSSILEKSEYITIEKGSAPTAAFSINNTFVKTGEEVQFTDESTDYPTEWKWKFGDGKSSDQQHPTHVYYNPGTYTVSLKVTNSEGDHKLEKEAIMLVEASARLNNNLLKPFKVYPNPSNGMLYIDYLSDIKSEVFIRILDVSGKEVGTYQFINSDQMQIDLGTQTKGLYFIILQTQQETITEKIIIQ